MRRTLEPLAGNVDQWVHYFNLILCLSNETVHLIVALGLCFPICFLVFLPTAGSTSDST